MQMQCNKTDQPSAFAETQIVNNTLMPRDLFEIVPYTIAESRLRHRPRRRLIERISRRIVHARTQPKGIRIQHRIVWIDHIAHCRQSAICTLRMTCKSSRLLLTLRNIHWSMIIIAMLRVPLIELRWVVALKLIRRGINAIFWIGLIEH